MNEWTAGLQILLVRELKAFEREIELFPDDGLVWKTGLFLLHLHLSAHLAHHLGQAGYLRRIVTGENRSSGAVAVKALAGDPA